SGRGGAKRSLGLGIEASQRKNELGTYHTNADSNDCRAPEVCKCSRAESPHFTQIAESSDAGEYGGCNERNDDHREEVQEQCTDRLERHRCREQGGAL